MKAVVYRWNQKDGHASWRPRSLVDMRGARFPEEYRELVGLTADTLEDAANQYGSELGDIIFMCEGDELVAYVAGPFGFELVKFGKFWKSPD